ncbi:MAG: PD40 domain-containing protein, partial [Planctomycetes bacterium]|nr:PD40 domain-containing protein [Planctomycetota bacterium]
MAVPGRRGVLVWLAAATAGACLVAPFLLRRTIRYYTDGAGLREPVQAARPALREVLWSPGAPVPAAINRPETDEYEPRVSPDGRFLVFTRGRPYHALGTERLASGADLWIAERRPAGWSEPMPFDAVNSDHDDMGASFATGGQGLLVFFYSNRPGGHGGYDIWLVEGDGGGAWGTPRNLGPQVNTPFSEICPSASLDGSALFFVTNRLGGGAPAPPRWTATARETLESSPYDVFFARRGAAAAPEYGEAALVEGLSLPGATEGSLGVSPHGDFVYFSSDRLGGLGGFDVYRARLAGGVIGPPENLGPQVNSAGHELDPALAANGFELYFARRPADRAAEDLFVAVSREVFLRAEAGETYWSFAAVLRFVAAALGRVHPTILALLLSVVACVLFAAVFGRRLSRLALLTRCLLIALLVHLLGALWMNTKEVQRVILTTLGGPEEEAPVFEVTVDGAAEEDVSLAIRTHVAETGRDAPPALVPGAMAQEPVLAPRGYSATPDVLEPRAAGLAEAWPRLSLEEAVRAAPAPGPAPSAPPAEARSVEPGFELAEAAFPDEDVPVDPALALAARDAEPPERAAPRPSALELGSQVRLSPPRAEVAPSPVGLEGSLEVEGPLFSERLSRPPERALERLEPIEDLDAAAAAAGEPPGEAREAAPAGIAAPRPLAGPERPAPAPPARLAPERAAADETVTISRVSALDARPSEPSDPGLLPRVAAAPERERPRAEAPREEARGTLPPAAGDTGLLVEAALPRPAAPEAAPEAARLAGSRLDVAARPEPGRARTEDPRAASPALVPAQAVPELAPAISSARAADPLPPTRDAAEAAGAEA